jgi:hypothetical protein
MIPGPGQSSESIRNFLKAEDVRRETKGQSSYFLTPYVSSDAAVKASILGFTGELVENISDGICVHPDIYAISTSAISVTQETEQVEIEQDFDREDAEFNSSNTVSPSTNTTYTATTTGDTCESTYSPEPTYRDCTSNGMTFCSGGKEYVCEGQTTTTGGGSSGSSGRIDLTESGERETRNTNQQLNQNIIYVDALGYIYDVYIEEITLDSAPKIQRRGGTKPIDPGKIETKLVVRFKTDRRVTILRGTLPETPAIDADCNDALVRQLSDVEDYFQINYPYDSEFYKYMKPRDEKKLLPAMTVFQIFQQDRVAVGRLLSARINGILFCRNKNGTKECVRNWYVASELNYINLFLGI